MTATYEDDVAEWALEQVALLRTGQWALLDIEHIAEEIEDMNISHRHQLAHRMAILMAHLLAGRSRVGSGRMGRCGRSGRQ